MFKKILTLFLLGFLSGFSQKKINYVTFYDHLNFENEIHITVQDSIGNLLGEGAVHRGHKTGMWKFYKRNGTTIYRKYQNNILFYDTIKPSRVLQKDTNGKYIFNYVGKTDIGWMKRAFGTLKNKEANQSFFKGSSLMHQISKKINQKKVVKIFKDSLFFKKMDYFDAQEQLKKANQVTEFRVRELQFFNLKHHSYSHRLLGIAPLVDNKPLFWVFAPDLVASFETGTPTYENLVFARYQLENIREEDLSTGKYIPTTYWEMLAENLEKEVNFIVDYEQSQDDVLKFYDEWSKNEDYEISKPEEISEKSVLPFAHKKFDLSVFDNKIYAFTYDDNEIYYREDPIYLEVYVYEIGTEKWKKIGFNRAVKSNYLSVRKEEKIFFFNADIINVYDLIDNTWSQISNGSKQLNGFKSQAFTVGSKIYFLYGNRVGVKSQHDIWIYDVETNSWSKRVHELPESITLPKTFVCGERMFVMDKITRTIFEYHYEKEIWIKLDLFQPFITNIEAISTVEDKLLFLLRNNDKVTNTYNLGLFDLETKEYGLSADVEISKENFSNLKTVIQENRLFLLGGVDSRWNQLGKFIEVQF